MRLGHALVLTRMLLRFFARKVMSAGALRSPVVRFLLAAGVVVLGVVCTGAAYLFLRPMAADEAVWRLVLESSTVSAVLWTQVAFLFVKVLFLSSEGLLELSFHLPLTGRERAVALLAYEAAMVLAVATAGLFAISASALLVLGTGAVLLLLETIVIPVLVTYGVLSLVHVAVLGLLSRTRLRRVAQLAGILVVFVGLLAYARQVGPLTGAMSERYLRHDTSFTLVTAPSWLAERYGALALLAVAGVTAAVLLGAVLALTPRQYVRPSRYLGLRPGGAARAVLTAYDRCLLRSSQTWLAAMAAGGVLVALCLRPAVNPLWAVSLLPLGGLYHYAATEPLRAAGWDRRPAWRVYASLLRAQGLLLAGGALVALGLVGAVTPAALPGAAVPVGGAVVAAVLATFIGVVFPAEHDNPFSVFIGISAVAMLAMVLAAALGILRLGPSIVLAVVVLLALAVSAYTVVGIRLNQQRSRHEEVVAGPQQRGGRVVAHRSGRGGHVALPHVLDR